MSTKRYSQLLIFSFIVLIYCAFMQAETSGQDRERDILNVPETSHRIKIDGRVDDDAWNNALKLTLDYEVQPGENVTPPVKTEFLVTYNRTHLFVAFRCFDPDPSKIRARLSDRDVDYGDDFVAIAVDTFNDERKNFILWSNPRGVQEDAIMTRNGSYDISWDGRYKSVGKIFDWGYGLEMSIPFSTLRFQRTRGPQVWGIDAWRIFPRSTRHLMGLFARNRSDSCYQCQMIKIKGFANIKPSRNLEITPTVTGVRSDTRDELPDGKLKKSNQDAEFGVTTRWGVTPNLTLSGTVNPDFSQVEADARQLDINQPFALSFSERRPFFTEGGNYLRTRMNALYSRTIRDPEWGVKLTGKEGKHSIGAYLVRDRITNLIFPGSTSSNSTSLDDASTATVIRYKHDLGQKYTVGTLFTNRQGGDYFNRVYGFDGVFRFTKKDQVSVEVLGSSTRYSSEVADAFGQENGRFGGTAFDVEYRHRTRNVYFLADYKQVDDNFRADLGFIPQVGYHRFKSDVRYTWINKPGQWWNQFRVGLFGFLGRTQSGELLYRGIEGNFFYEGIYQSVFSIFTTITREGYNGNEFDLFFSGLGFSIQPTREFGLSISAHFGDRIDFNNNREGKRFRFSPSLSYSFNDHMRFSLRHTYERMRASGQWLYTANISQGTIIYQFDTRMFFRSILQYVDYSYNVDNYLSTVEPEFKQLFLQLLFSYKLNPRTVLFLGYTDNYLGSREFPITRSNRTLFFKIGYAWQI